MTVAMLPAYYFALMCLGLYLRAQVSIHNKWVEQQGQRQMREDGTEEWLADIAAVRDDPDTVAAIYDWRESQNKFAAAARRDRSRAFDQQYRLSQQHQEVA